MKTLWFSLRRRLLALVLGGVSAAWLATMVLSYLDAHNQVDELFDAQLVQSAQALLALSSRDDSGSVEDLGEAVHKYQRRLRFQIWQADGRLLLRSADAPTTPLALPGGFSETQDEHGHWRHYSQWNRTHTLHIQISEDHQIRDQMIGHIAWRLLLPALFGLPLMGIGIWVAMRRGLASLDDVARDIARRAPQQLHAVEPATAPAEIRPLVEALNDLFRRVENTLAGERRFTADAAHELRTPLAALKAQLQVAQRARDDDERDRSFIQLQHGLDRAAHLVDQMLQLARLDPESGLPNPQPVDLGALAADVCAELGALILDQSIDFELIAQPGCTVRGQAEWLRVLLRNLVDNAVRYTPQGGRIIVRVASDPVNGRHPWLAVDDSGPGIPPEQRTAVLRRFHRLDSAKPGSGLGLAIVARIVELHGATLSLETAAEGGLRVSVRWLAAD